MAEPAPTPEQARAIAVTGSADPLSAHATERKEVV